MQLPGFLYETYINRLNREILTDAFGDQAVENATAADDEAEAEAEAENNAEAEDENKAEAEDVNKAEQADHEAMDG
eukprot:15448742-Alexandrium_andersonii.AAC.1